MEQTIDLFSAITQMRELSKAERAFSFSFMSYNRSRQTSDGVVSVNKAILRPGSTEKDTDFSDFLLNYRDLETGKNHRCYQVTIMYFNNKKVTIKQYGINR